MGALTNYVESGLLNHLLRSVDFSKPTSLKIGLVGNFNTSNLESGLLTDEISGGSYARVSYNADSSSWIAPYSSGTASVTHNTQPIEFPQATSDIGNVSGVFILDGSNNMLFYGQLATARNIRNGDQFVFSSGTLKVTFD